jgi:hypothetical protein
MGSIPTEFVFWREATIASELHGWVDVGES